MTPTHKRRVTSTALTSLGTQYPRRYGLVVVSGNAAQESFHLDYDDEEGLLKTLDGMGRLRIDEDKDATLVGFVDGQTSQCCTAIIWESYLRGALAL